MLSKLFIAGHLSQVSLYTVPIVYNFGMPFFTLLAELTFMPKLNWFSLMWI